MKIVVSNIEDKEHDFLIYLKTDDDVAVSAQLATLDTYEHIIDDLIFESGESSEDVPVFWPIVKKEEKMNDEQIPMVLVFYLDRGLMANREIIGPFAEAVNQSIAEREANAMAFFLPTDGEERIECINPTLATPEEKTRITEMISEIEKSFDVNQGADED